MSYQLVVSGNRILAHGTNCFYSMGGTVVCPDTQKVYQNATVVICDALPSDIDVVGYEYHSGEFVPCAPFGKGTGSVALYCDENCKVPKDSGLSLSEFALLEVQTYEGSGQSGSSNPSRLTFKNGIPDVILIQSQNKNSQLIITQTMGVSCYALGENTQCEVYMEPGFSTSNAITPLPENTVQWYTNANTLGQYRQCSVSGTIYTVYALIRRV